MAKKIIVICYNYEPEQFPKEPDEENDFYTYGFGGNVGRNFKKYLSNNYEIEVWRLDGYVKNFYEKSFLGIKFRVFPSFHINNVSDFSLRFLRELRKETKKSNPILFVIHTHHWLAYEIAFLFRKCRILTTHHGDWSPLFKIKFMKGLRKIKAYMDIFFEKRTFKHIDCILTIDNRQIKYLKQINPGIKCLIWSRGIDFNSMKPIPKLEARKILGWDSDKKYIFYVGKLYKYKQVDILINIWKEIKQTRPEVELVLAGNAVHDPWEEFYDLAVESGALLLGRILNKELYKYYSAADVYVLMALREDYFGGPGIAAIESLACNTPVISYALRNYLGDNIEDIGEVPQTIEETKNAILRVLDNPEIYKNMRDSAEKYYSTEAMVKRVENVFDGFIDNEKRSFT